MGSIWDWIVGVGLPIVTGTVMLFGLLGLVMPIFPGGLVIWIAALIYGIFAGFNGPIFAIITLLAVASAAADNVFMGAKARDAGASWRGILLALAAALVGSLVFPPIGGLILAPIVLYLSEYRRLQGEQLPEEVDLLKARTEAQEITKGLVLGCGWAFVARFGLGILKIGLWLVWVISS